MVIEAHKRLIFSTCGQILRQHPKFQAGVQRLVRMASFLNGSDDEGMVKWFHRLLGQIVLRILKQEHSDGELNEIEADHKNKKIKQA